MSNAVISNECYKSIALLLVRLCNSGLTENQAVAIMHDTLGAKGEAVWSDLLGWRAADILAKAQSLNIRIVPARLNRVTGAIGFIKPTTPCCTGCDQFTITDETGPWQVIQPGSSCPVCNEYIRPSTVVTKRVNWTTGLEVGITEEFDRSGAEPIPLTERGILEYVTRRKKVIDDYFRLVIGNELNGIANPYLRLLNVLACHPEYASRFQHGPLQIISVLWTPDSFGLVENSLKHLGVLARERWWTRQPKLATPVVTSSAAAPEGQVSRSKLRQLIGKVFVGDEFSTFCFDYYEEVYSCFTQGMDTTQRVNLLFGHAVTDPADIQLLLQNMRRAKQERYDRYVHLLNSDS